MNAKDRLRAYLEQRRDLGESEMVLDALDVDDVMRMLGALQGGDAVATSPHASAPRAPIAPMSNPDEKLPAFLTNESASDERAPFTASPPPGDSTPPFPPRDSSASSSPAPQSSPRNDTPPERERSDQTEVSGDWREVMRNLQGGAPKKPVASHPVASPQHDATEAITPARTPLRGVLRVEGIVFPLGLRVERPDVLLRSETGKEWQSIAEVTAAISTCNACSLSQSATRPVPGTGDPFADVMVVGEAPGEQEDLAGEPFVGPAGQLLTKILSAIQLSRESVYICNVLKHRPPGNRNPLPEEVRACSPFLQRQIDLVQPKMILAFGAFAAQTLLETKLAISKLRQQIHWYQGIPLVATYHPAALLRNDAWKRPTWEDVKLARRVLDATIRTDDQS